MTRHVSTDNLARLRDGELGGARAWRVEAHLRRCARCRSTSAALDEIPALLAATRVPQMPEHLVARIETALATESAHRAADARETQGARGAPAGARAGGARRKPRRPAVRTPALRWAAAAAAAAVVVTGGAELVAHLGGQSSELAGTAAGGGNSGQRGSHRASSGQHAAVVPRPGQFGPMIRYQQGAHSAAVHASQTGTNYQRATLGRQAAAALLNAPPAVAGQGTGGVTNSTGAGSVRPGLSACVSRIAAGRKVRLVDLAKYRGAPATVIVTAAKGSAPEQVWVVGPRCSASASDILASQPLHAR